MEHLIKSLSGASGETLGVSIAVALILAGWLTLDGPLRQKLHQPIGFLLAHLVLKGLELLVAEDSALYKLLAPLALGTLLISIGRAGVVLVLEAIMDRRLHRPLPKIIRDILQGVVYFVLLLAVLRKIGVETGQLVTTSALLTAVIGLSLQDTLGNLIAGLAVQIQKPFDIGDWLQYDTDPKNIGRVIEINWRSTTLVTLDEVEIIVPNGHLAKTPLKNYSRPTGTIRRSIYVTAGYDTPPARVHKAILAALDGLPGVLKRPPPTVVTLKFADSGIDYWLRAFISDFERRDLLDGMIRDRIWYNFRRAGIGIPYPHRTVQMHSHDHAWEERQLAQRIDLRLQVLTANDFFSVIDEKERLALARQARVRLFDSGEVIVRQGERADGLFVIMRGEVAVTVTEGKSEIEVARLATGKLFGEMAFMTGEVRVATVRAAGECELLVIEHEVFKELLQASPEVADRVSELLAERRVMLDESLARSTEERTTMVRETSTELLGRIKRFFSLK